MNKLAHALLCFGCAEAGGLPYCRGFGRPQQHSSPIGERLPSVFQGGEYRYQLHASLITRVTGILVFGNPHALVLSLKVGDDEQLACAVPFWTLQTSVSRKAILARVDRSEYGWGVQGTLPPIRLAQVGEPITLQTAAPIEDAFLQCTVVRTA